MKNWKQILYRAVAVLSAVAVFTVQVPDLRMRAYAVDPFTAMAGEEVVSYVISAIAAACGVNISSDSSDVAADVRFWVSQAKDDYEIRARVADKEVIKTVAAVSFVRAQEYFQSLADKTFTLVDNGLAVPRDVMDAVSAYFNAKTKAYTPDFSQKLPYASYRGVHSSPCVVTGWAKAPGSSSSWNYLVTFSFPSGLKFVYAYQTIAFFNTTDTDIIVTRFKDDYFDNKFYDHDTTYTYVVPAHDTKVVGWQYLTNILQPAGIESGVKYGLDNTTSLLRSYLLKTLDQAYGSVVDNGVLDEVIPSDNWQWLQVENAQTGTAEDVVILQPDAAPTEEELNQRLADALVAGLLGDLLEQLGIMAKEAEQPPEPSSSEEESSEPAIVPTDPPVPSESPSESLDPEPGGDPDPGGDPEPDGSIQQIIQLLEGIAAVPGKILDFFTIKSEPIQEAYGDLADAFQGRFSGIKQLGSVFNVSRVFDRTVPYFTMPTPDPFKFAIDSPTIVVLDLRPFEDMFVWVRRILNAILWYAFASWFINQFDVKLHIG